MRNILLLGGTGSVGSSSLQVIHENKNKFCLYGISFDKNVDRAFQIIKDFSLIMLTQIMKRQQRN